MIAGYEDRMLKPTNATLGILISQRTAQVVAAFPHDADGIGHHGCMVHRPRCNSSRTGWSARVYAHKRYTATRAACAQSVRSHVEMDSWRTHRAFVYSGSRTANCAHRSRGAAEVFQRAYLSLIERKPLPRLPDGRRCSPGPLWNQLMVTWKFSDVIGVVYSEDALHAATRVREAIMRLDKLFAIERPQLRMYQV